MQNNYSYELTDAEMQEISRRAEAAIKRGDRLNLSPLKKSLSLLFYPYLVLLYSKTIEKEH